MATFEMSDREERALSPAEMCDRLEGMMCNLDDARAGAASLRHYLHRLSQLVCAAWGDDQGSERIRALRARATALIVDAASRVGQLKGDEALEVKEALRYLDLHLGRAKKSCGLVIPERKVVHGVLAQLEAMCKSTTRAQAARDAEEERSYEGGVCTPNAPTQSAAIMSLVAARSPPVSEAADKRQLHSWLQEKLQSKFPGAELVAYGSSASGLCLSGADLDLCLRLPTEGDFDGEASAEYDDSEAGEAEIFSTGGDPAVGRVQHMSENAVEMKLQLERQREEMVIREMASVLRPHVTDAQEVTAARVPILKLRMENLPFVQNERKREARLETSGGVVVTECDIAVDHELPLRNTMLLRTYHQIDPRAHKLLLAVKVWAKQAGVADSVNGTLSSYAWALLCVFFLQQVEPPVLPVLQSEELVGNTWKRPAVKGCEVSFNEDATEAAQFLLDKNTSTVAELLHQFFHFYGWKFAFARQVCSPRKGQALQRTELQSKTEWRFCIEDPFERLRDLGSTITSDAGQRAITHALRHATAVMMQPETPCLLPDAWIDDTAVPQTSCSNCCSAGHFRSQCPHVDWPCQMLCFCCGQAGHGAAKCPHQASTTAADSATEPAGSKSPMQKLNGMRPFPIGFDPQLEHNPVAIPKQFDDPEAYFHAMQQNILAETSAMVRFSKADEFTAEVVAHGVLRFPPAHDLDHSWWKHLVRTPEGDCYVVYKDEAEYAVAHGGRPSPRIVEIKEMPFKPVGDKIVFRSYGFLGDMIHAYESIAELQELHKMGNPPDPLLTATMSGGVEKSTGCYAEYDGVVRGNAEQQAVLSSGFCSNLPVIQGPPGTGKTKLIVDILASRVQPGTSTLVTSVSNQAIDNLAEVMETTCPTLNFVTLGVPKRFFALGRLNLFKHSLEVLTIKHVLRMYCVSDSQMHHQAKQLCDTNLLDLVLSPTVDAPRTQNQLPWMLLRQCVADFNKRWQGFIDQAISQMGTLDTHSQRWLHTVNLRRAHARLCLAKVGTVPTSPASALSNDVLGLVATKLAPVRVTRAKRALWTYAMKPRTDRLADELRDALDAPYQEQLDRIIKRAERDIVNRCTTFVCTVGSIERAASAKIRIRNIRTAIVDEASLLPEYAVPRLLTLRPRLDNLILVGDHKQLEPFSQSPTGTICGSLMQRCAEVSGCQMLTEQYRMAPEICAVVSRVFYDSKLRTNPKTAVARLKEAEHRLCDSPVQMHPCCGEERQLYGSSSYYNSTEVLAIELWYRQMRQVKTTRHRSILIITLYSAQCTLLKQILPADTELRDRMRYKKYKDLNLKIVTVDGSQGSQADIVALSCVRSNTSGVIGHARSAKRANVALSRAKSELHLFGNFDVLGRWYPWRDCLDVITGTAVEGAISDPYEQYQVLGFSYDDIDWSTISCAA